MKNLFNFNKILSVKAIKEGGRNPYVDWAIIIIICTLSSFAMIFYGVVLYKKVGNDKVTSIKVATDSKLKTFNQQDLQFIVDRFNAKSANTIKYKKSYKALEDPS